MKPIFKKIRSVLLLVPVAFILFMPLVLAQNKDLFDETLDVIKEKGGVKVDFSLSENRKWGNLPLEAQQIVSSKPEYTKIDDLISAAEGKWTNRQDLVNFIAGEFGDSVIAGEAPDPNDPTKTVVVLTPNGEKIVSEIMYQGESQLHAVVLAVAKVFRNVMGALAVVWIIVAGIMMIFAQGEETKITEQKRAITYAIIGLIAIVLIERFVNAIYGIPGEERMLTPSTALQVDREVYALISYVKATLGAAAIFMIILSGIKTIAAQGEEEKMTTQKKAILWTIIGLALILVNRVVVENIFTQPVRETGGQITQTNIQKILSLSGNVINFLLGFVGLAAFAALVYGGASMVANYGNDEMVERAKKVIKNAVIGIIIILSAYAIVNTMLF